MTIVNYWLWNEDGLVASDWFDTEELVECD